ncbi:MAG: PilZ domain-containing protein [Pseudomonadales bacterium]|nr:PilZ domain-containing protein [Pseudomonadales bacterium]
MDRQRRSEPRKKPDRLIEAFLRNGEPFGRVMNLTRHGLMLAHTQPLPGNTIIPLSLKYLHQGVPVTIDMSVEGLWHSATPESGKGFWSGCQIVDIDSDALQVLENLLQTLSEYD